MYPNGSYRNQSNKFRHMNGNLDYSNNNYSGKEYNANHKYVYDKEITRGLQSFKDPTSMINNGYFNQSGYQQHLNRSQRETTGGTTRDQFSQNQYTRGERPSAKVREVGYARGNFVLNGQIGQGNSHMNFVQMKEKRQRDFALGKTTLQNNVISLRNGFLINQHRYNHQSHLFKNQQKVIYSRGNKDPSAVGHLGRDDFEMSHELANLDGMAQHPDIYGNLVPVPDNLLLKTFPEIRLMSNIQSNLNL